MDKIKKQKKWQAIMQYFTNKACGTSMKLLVLKHLIKKNKTWDFSDIWQLNYMYWVLKLKHLKI